MIRGDQRAAGSRSQAWLFQFGAHQLSEVPDVAGRIVAGKVTGIKTGGAIERIERSPWLKVALGAFILQFRMSKRLFESEHKITRKVWRDLVGAPGPGMASCKRNEADAGKSQAESIARGIAASQVVAKQIAVIPLGGESAVRAMDFDIDTGIEKNLDVVLIQNELHRNVKYDVKNSVVTLTGEVSSHSVRAQAEQIASSVLTKSR